VRWRGCRFAVTAEGTQIVIHAMPMRDKYARLLEQ
jgi:hypothetical protein